MTAEVEEALASPEISERLGMLGLNVAFADGGVLMRTAAAELQL